MMHQENIGTQNRSRFVDPEFVALINQAVTTVDESDRVALLYEITRMANENVTWIPNSMAMQMRVYNSRLHAPEPAPTGALNVQTMIWTE